MSSIDNARHGDNSATPAQDGGVQPGCCTAPMAQDGSASSAGASSQSIQPAGRTRVRNDDPHLDLPRIDRVLAWAQRRLATRRGYALLYFLLFSITWIPIMGTILLAGKSFFWQTDGLSQQYVWFVYTGQWLRDLFSTLITEHRLHLPEWTIYSGYGTDIIMAFGSTLAQPFYWLSALVPSRYAEFAFEFIIILMVYLGGLAFSAWALQRGCTRSSTLIGAICYAFAGNVCVMFTQPSFLLMLIVGPLVLLGTDRIFAHKSPALFLLVMSWTFLITFYDAYMVCILLVIYCLFNFFFYTEKDRPRAGRGLRLLGWVGLFVWLIVISMLVACILMLPQVMNIIESSRLEVERTGYLLYATYYYSEFLSSFLTTVDLGGDAFFGVNVLGGIVVLFLLLRFRSHKALCLAVVLFLVMLLLPVFGRIMNGFQYPANRWSWAFDILCSYAIARVLPQTLKASRRERLRIGVVIALYGVIILALPLPGRDLVFGICYMTLLLMAFVLFTARQWKRERILAAICCVAMLSGAVTFCTYISPYFINKATQLVGFDKNWLFHTTQNAQGLISQVDDYDSMYRYDRPTTFAGAIHNSNLITSLMAPDYYNSFYNQDIDNFNTSLGLVDTEGLNFRYGSLNARVELMALLGVKYYYIATSYLPLLPASFQDGQSLVTAYGRGGEHQLFETDMVAPLAFVSTSYITTEDYYALNQVDRGAALLQGLVLDEDDVTEGMQDVSDELEGFSSEIPYTITGSSDVIFEDGGFRALSPNAWIDISFETTEDAETYLQVTGLSFEDIPLRDHFTDAGWEKLGFIGRMQANAAQVTLNPVLSGKIAVMIGDACPGIFYVLNESHNLYGGKHDWSLNMGTAASEKGSVRLRIKTPGRFSYDSLTLRTLPLDSMEAQVETLKANGASNITLVDNGISAHASSETAAQLFFSVAYSSGWTATVDGEPATIHKADIGFISVDIPAGEHDVLLTYHTPYLDEGCVLSVVGLVLCVLSCLGLRWWRGRKQPARLAEALPAAELPPVDSPALAADVRGQE